MKPKALILASGPGVTLEIDYAITVRMNFDSTSYDPINLMPVAVAFNFATRRSVGTLDLIEEYSSGASVRNEKVTVAPQGRPRQVGHRLDELDGKDISLGEPVLLGPFRSSVVPNVVQLRWQDPDNDDLKLNWEVRINHPGFGVVLVFPFVGGFDVLCGEKPVGRFNIMPAWILPDFKEP